MGKIMNIFKSQKVYFDSWEVSDSRNFEEEEISAVKSAYVVPSEFGNSCCFLMKSGGKTYIPMSRDSSLSVGESVDLKKAKLLTLSREGDSDIYRVEI